MITIVGIDELPGVRLTPLKQIANENGSVFHVVRKTDSGFFGFGETYISTVRQGVIKGWKCHREMTLNLVVPVGSIEFRALAETADPTRATICGGVELSATNYHRLTVAPGVWLSFKGKSEGLNMLINVADMVHDPAEVNTIPIDAAALRWCWENHR